MYQAEKALRDLGDRVPANDRQTIETQLQAVKQAAEGEDANSIRTSMQNLQNATYALTQQMYATDTSAANGGTSTPQGSHGHSEPDVVEGDFSEV